MKCPKCHHTMTVKNFGPSVAIQRWGKCHGIWCSLQNIEQLDRLPMLDVLDIGDAKRGQLYNEITEIDCPQCGKPMAQQLMPRQDHIRVELCEPCSGVFLDAGELRDAAHITFGEWLRSLRLNLAVRRRS
jgi:Zn-finger nucleic acid-binding protein